LENGLLEIQTFTISLFFFLTDPNIRQPAFDWLSCSDQSESLQSNGAK